MHGRAAERSACGQAHPAKPDSTYGGLACSSMLGGLVLLVIDRHYLSLVGAAMVLLALVLAEVTHAAIVRREPPVGFNPGGPAPAA